MKNADIAEGERYRAGSPFVLLFGLYIGLGLLITGIFIISNLLEIPIEHFTADPAVTLNAHPLTGFLSHIGALFWCASAVACLFAYAMARIKGNFRYMSFLLASGLLSLLLLFDDLFMFHEAILPWYFHMPQKLVYAGYLLIMLGYLFYFRNELLESEYSLLIVAVIFLSLSVIGDFVLPQEGTAYMVEDGFKIFGIVAWFLFFWRVAMAKAINQDF